MDNWQQGFNAVDDADALRKESVKGPEAKIKAGRDAAADVIDSGVLGDGPHTVSINGSEPLGLATTLSISITSQPALPVSTGNNDKK